MNLGPRADGTIPPEQESILRGVGSWLYSGVVPCCVWVTVQWFYILLRLYHCTVVYRAVSVSLCSGVTSCCVCHCTAVLYRTVSLSLCNVVASVCVQFAVQLCCFVFLSRTSPCLIVAFQMVLYSHE